MIKKVWMFFIVAVQVVLVVLIALFAYHAGYQVIDWKLIPLLFVCDFIVADIMMYRYLVKRRELKRKQLEIEVLSTELGRQTEYYDKVIGQLEEMSMFRHDFRNYIQTVYALIDREAYAEARDILDTYARSINKSEKL